jgi:putative ABC transport system permease protein
MDNFLQDIRYGIRAQLANPVTSVMAIITLALGIGAISAIFSIVNGVLLRPLNFKNADRLVMLWQSNPSINIGYNYFPVSPGNFVDWRNGANSFDAIAAMRQVKFNLSGRGLPKRIEGVAVSYNFFNVLGVEPEVGYGFSPEQDNAGADRVVILGNSFWKSEFGGSRDIVGKQLIFNNVSYVIVGAMPEVIDFPTGSDMPAFMGFPRRVDFWIPLALTNQEISNRGNISLGVIARLKEGVRLNEAQAEMARIAEKLAQIYPQNRGFGVTMLTLREQILGDISFPLLVLMGAVVLVLLIACINVANLMLTRATSRTREIATRIALGAGPCRIIRQLLTESTILALLGGCLGLLVNLFCMDLILNLGSNSLPRVREIKTDASVFIFILAISVLTGILFGLAPALQAKKLDMTEALREGSRGATVGYRQGRMRALLVLVQVAMSLVLLAGAGLLLRSFARVIQIDPGFNPKELVTLEIPLPPEKYPDASQKSLFFRELLNRVATLPGINSVGLASSVPLTGAEDMKDFTVEEAPQANGTRGPIADYRVIGGNYFEAMGIQLLKGRNFVERDDKANPMVCIISQTLANKYFPEGDMIGKRLKFGSVTSSKPWLSIVGVVKDVKITNLTADLRPQIYVPYLQAPLSIMAVVVRTNRYSVGVSNAIAQTVLGLDSEQPVVNIKTMEQILSDSLRQRSFTMMLINSFSVVAVILAAVGIYGIMSYSVKQRTNEIGIRMALGARPADIMKLIVVQAMIITACGIILGLLAAFILTRLIEGFLYQISPNDPTTYLSAILLLALVMLLASYIPARRASKVDPLIALRHQ